MEEMMKLSQYQERTFKRNLDVIQALEHGFSAREVARNFHLSLATVYNIRAAATQSGGLRALIPKSKAPKSKPQVDPLVIGLIDTVREQTGFGAEKICDYLLEHARQYQLDPAEIPGSRMIHKILKSKGRILPRLATRQIYKPDYYHTRSTDKPNDIVEVDIKSDHYLEKKPVIVHGSIDISSKVTSVLVNLPQTAEAAALNLLEHLYHWGMIRVVKTDNDMVFIGQVEGSSFGLFSRLCLFLGIEHICIPVHSPRWNPFIENFFGTWDREFFNFTYHCGHDKLVHENHDFLVRYHTERSHQGLKKNANNPDRIKFPEAFHLHYGEINYPVHDKEELIHRIKTNTIPLCKGRISFIRKVPKSGVIRFKGNQFKVPTSFSGMMIKGTIEVDPENHPFPVNLYYREHKMVQAEYKIQRYDVKRLGKF
jgi:hypothetical protein